MGSFEKKSVSRLIFSEGKTSPTSMEMPRASGGRTQVKIVQQSHQAEGMKI